MARTVPPISMQNKKDVKSVENIEKLLKTWIMSYFGAQNDPEIGPLSPMININVKVDQIDM